ncbi:MAG: hypothetical protein JSS53_10535 [Proteobacteria bacterium]|nr:hypothetical protein [Pseudomonadota bacterium]
MSTSKSSRSKSLYSLRRWPMWMAFGALWLLVQFPHSIRLRIGRWLGLGGFYLAKKVRRITEINLRLCFPNLTESERTQLTKKSFESVGMGFIEAGVAWWIPKKRLPKLKSIEGIDYYHQARKEGKATLVLGLHLTTIELVGRLMADHFDYYVMYQKIKNPIFNLVITRARDRIYPKAISNNNIRELIRLLKAKEPVWYAPDQNPAGSKKTYAPFFGVNAATSCALEQIVKMTDAVVLPALHYRNSDGSYSFKLLPPLKNFSQENSQENAKILNQCFEEMIMHCPEQYLWQYKRFKDPAPGEKDVYAES